MVCITAIFWKGVGLGRSGRTNGDECKGSLLETRKIWSPTVKSKCFERMLRAKIIIYGKWQNVRGHHYNQSWRKWSTYKAIDISGWSLEVVAFLIRPDLRSKEHTAANLIAMCNVCKCMTHHDKFVGWAGCVWSHADHSFASMSSKAQFDNYSSITEITDRMV